MSDESTVSSASPDTGVAATTSTDGGSGSGDGLQSSMVGDFFTGHAYDDGGGGVINRQTGDSLLDENGQKFRGRPEDALKRAQTYWESKNKTAKPSNQQLPGQQNAAGRAVQFGDFIKADGQVDYSALATGATAFNSFQRKSGSDSFIKPPTAGIQTTQQQQLPSDPVQAIRQQTGNMRTELENTRLNPLATAWEGIVRLHGGDPSKVPVQFFNVVNAEFTKQKEAIDKLVQDKYDSLLSEMISKQNERVDPKVVDDKYSANYSAVAQRYFKGNDPNQSVASLNALIFGKVDPVKKIITQPGYGVDVVDALFKAALRGFDGKPKTFSSQQEWADAYFGWWKNIGSQDPELLDLVARSAFDRLSTSNLPKIRDTFRATWEQENRQRGAQAGRAPNANAGAPAPDSNALGQYFAGAPK